jgi:rhamnose utilization protein RhaD (predicted bifunctional aldolase and dehydrogenase)
MIRGKHGLVSCRAPNQTRSTKFVPALSRAFFIGGPIGRSSREVRALWNSTHRTEEAQGVLQLFVPWWSISPMATRREVNSMDKEKEGILGTIAEAAKTSMEATVEGVSSAASAIAEAVTGTTEKPRRRRKRSTTKKATASRGRTTTRRAKARRRSSAAATRRGTRKAATRKAPLRRT